MIMKVEIIAHYASWKFIQLHQSRIAAKVKIKLVWPFNVTIANDATLEQIYRTVINLLN